MKKSNLMFISSIVLFSFIFVNAVQAHLIIAVKYNDGCFVKNAYVAVYKESGFINLVCDGTTGINGIIICQDPDELPNCPHQYWFKVFYPGIGGILKDDGPVGVDSDCNGYGNSNLYEDTCLSMEGKNCVDGYCCNSACTETCKACNLAGSEGNCAFISNSQDPNNECPEDSCKYGYCNGAGACAMKPTTTDCGTCALCNGSGNCDIYDSSQNIDCNPFDIATCTNDPDLNPFTWDYRDSYCTALNTCYQGSITHTCDKTSCNAECDSTHSCQNKCVGNVRYYNGNCLSSCNCSWTTVNCDLQDGCYAYGNGCEIRDYFCQPSNCNYTFSSRSTDSYDVYVNYCSADTIRTHRTLHDFYCSGACSDHTSFVNDSLVEDCNLKDDWYNTTNYNWTSTGQCTEKQQIQQEYRDYTCSAAACIYTVTNNRWIDTGATRNKDNGTSCDDGLFCTVSDQCSLGVCSGAARDCSDSNQCTNDICNETAGLCQHSNVPDGANCTGDPGKCCSGICDNNGTSGLDYAIDCRGGPSCLAPGNWEYSTANQGLGCGSFANYCNNPLTCDSHKHQKSCNLGYCTGGWTNDQDTTSNACQYQDCGTCCSCGSNDNRSYNSTQNNDCTQFNISGIATCFNNPDNYNFTWDFRNPFTSICSSLDTCDQGNLTITHTCSLDNCSAECDSTHSCQNKCIGNVRYYAGSCSLTSCNCSYSTDNCTAHNGCYAYDSGCEDRNYFCTPGLCNYTFTNRHTDYYDNFTNYCSGDTIRKNQTFHNFSCDSNCKDHASFVNDSLVQDCSLQNGWYNTSSTQWVNDTSNECKEKEQVWQEYHDFTCNPSSVSCTYSITQTRWNDTGNTRSKANGTQCGGSPSGACDAQDTCQSGVCADNVQPDTCVCRASQGLCDLEEKCDGSTKICPSDAKSTALCRVSAGDCDIAEYCNGVNNDCPADQFKSSSVVCRASAGVCDLEEKCTGSSANCPSDLKSTALCRAAAGQCDVAEYCDGANNSCPADAKAPQSTSCNDGLWCSATDHCDGNGNCVQLTARNCSSNNLQGIATCDWNPDNYHPTWDYRQAFTSQCDETADKCTTGDATITHTCADNDLTDTVKLGGCGASCDEDKDCPTGICNTNCTCVIDSTPPVITILSPGSTYYTNIIPLVFTVNEATSWIGYSLDSQANVTLGTNKTAGTYSKNIFVNYGSHNIIVYANDTSGNMGKSNKVYFTVKQGGGGGNCLITGRCLIDY